MKIKKDNLILIPLIGVGIFILFYYFLSPSTVSIRNNPIPVIIFRIAFSFFLIYLAFFQKRKIPLMGSIIICLFVVIFWMNTFLFSRRIDILLYLIYGYVNILYYIIYYKKHRIERKSIWFIGASSFLIAIAYHLKVTYVYTNFPFWITPLIVASVLFLIALYFSVFMPHLFSEKQNRITIPLLCLMVGFGVSWLTIGVLNYCLDTSTARYESYEVIDKEIRTGARRITTYEITVQNGEDQFNVIVDDEDYYQYEIGDLIPLSIYNGAFHESYYIYEPKS